MIAVYFLYCSMHCETYEHNMLFFFGEKRPLILRPRDEQ